ncbi:MAG TPA: bifunctional riboflavin kinase/FMN adenylyltransferase, partial [Gemmatimonadales bacterium]|nr:bifunctional riboflavin kinase/FMN adenylyltransferase [Gemmatimonadales bacterium]
MEIFHSLEQIAQPDGRSVVTIGSFDGIHRAHQELLERVRQLAREADATSVAVTFDPHPVQILAPEKAPKLLTPLPIKLELLEQSGIDRLLILPFTRELSRWSPEQFVQEVLVKAVRAVAVLVGENFRFGHKQAGNPQVMADLGRRFQFQTEILPFMQIRGQTVSSSQIRSLLEQGKITLANRLLGRPFSVRNAIESGLGIGRSQTVPTLNLAPYFEMLPAAGVYVTWAKLRNGIDENRKATHLRSVTNAGCRPTFGERDLGVETHLLDAYDGPAP